MADTKIMSTMAKLAAILVLAFVVAMSLAEDEGNLAENMQDNDRELVAKRNECPWNPHHCDGSQWGKRRARSTVKHPVDKRADTLSEE